MAWVIMIFTLKLLITLSNVSLGNFLHSPNVVLVETTILVLSTKKHLKGLEPVNLPMSGY